MRETVIKLDGVSKCYRSYTRDLDRLLEVITGKARHHAYYALQPVSLDVARGEVIGLVGKNGAGKSTLLKLLATTLQPSTGTISIDGRVSAILELGASFHPEMSGHDNVYLTCAIQGLSREETAAAYASIVEFAGIGDFIDRPVKTYSSGMTMRLAFAIATNVNPDILIIDEALSVGDGVFARRSFDRIMEFRKAGKTIFFCSHSLYQVEALCDRVLWLDRGEIRSQGEPAKVITDYGDFLQKESAHQETLSSPVATDLAHGTPPKLHETPRVTAVKVTVDGANGAVHLVHSGKSNVDIEVAFSGAAAVAAPSIALVFLGGDGRVVSSVTSKIDDVVLTVDARGQGIATINFPQFPLLKGSYILDIYLMCEEGIHVYERVRQVATFNVEQQDLTLGVTRLPHRWSPQ